MPDSNELQKILEKYAEQARSGQKLGPEGEEVDAENPNLLEEFKWATADSKSNLHLEPNSPDKISKRETDSQESQVKTISSGFHEGLAVEEKGADVLPIIPGYTISGELGRGGMGVVYKGIQTTLGRPVAIKTLLHAGKVSEELKSRIRKEAAALSLIHHPNIVQVYDINEYEGIPYLVMELIDGASLEAIISGRVVRSREAAKLLVTLADAIEAAHKCGIVHRDIKPANILMQGGIKPREGDQTLPPFHLEDSAAKITDFGLAKKLEEEQGKTLGWQGKTQGVVGTPSYMAPEQANPALGHIGPWTDVYSLGVLLYEMLVGKPPFLGTTAMETLRQVCSLDPIAPTKLRSGIATDLETICLKCLSKQPLKRYATAQELSQDLNAFLHDQPIKARRAPWHTVVLRWSYRNPALATSLLFTLLGLSLAIGMGTFYLNEKLANDQRQLAGLQESLGFERIRANDLSKAKVWFGASLINTDGGNNIAMKRLRLGLLIDSYFWIRSLVIHEKGTQGAQWSPSGGYYLSYGRDKSIRVHDPSIFPATLENPATVAETLLPLSGDIQTACFLGDDRVLVLTSNSSLYVWHWKKQKELRLISTGIKSIAVEFLGTQLAYELGGKIFLNQNLKDDQLENKPALEMGISPIRNMAFLPDGSGLVAHSNHEIAWISREGKVKKLQGVKNGLWCMAISPDGKKVAAGTVTGEVQVWELDSLQLEPKFGYSHLEQVLCLVFNQDSSLIASGGADNRAMVWNIQEKAFKVQVLHKSNVTCLAFNPKPQWLITGSSDSTVRIFSPITGRPASSDMIYNGTLRFLAPHPRAHLLVAGGDDNTCVLWDTLPKNKLSIPLEEKLDQLLLQDSGLVYYRNGPKVKVASTRQITEAIESTQERYLNFDREAFEKSILPIHDNASLIGRLGTEEIAILNQNGTMEIWQETAKMSQFNLKTPKGNDRIVALIGSSGGKFLALEILQANGHKAFQLYNRAGDSIDLQTLGEANSMAFSQDETKFAWGDYTGNIHILDITKGSSGRPIVLENTHNGPVSCLTFSKDGLLLASGGQDMFLRLWNLHSKKMVWGKDPSDSQHVGTIKNIIFDETTLHQERIFSCGEDSTLRTWKLQDGTAVNEAMLHDSAVTDLIIWQGLGKPNGKKLGLTRSAEGAISLWDMGKGQRLSPPLYPLGFQNCGFGFSQNASEYPAIIFAGSYGSLNVVRLQKSPEKLGPFSFFHSAFKIQDKKGPTKGTVLVPMAGSVLLPPKDSDPAKQYDFLMYKMLRDFNKVFPPITKLTLEGPEGK